MSVTSAAVESLGQPPFDDYDYTNYSFITLNMKRMEKHVSMATRSKQVTVTLNIA